jgi:hypothetical protein
LENVDIGYGHLEHFMGIWDISMTIWYIFPVLVSFPKKNLATLRRRQRSREKISKLFSEQDYSRIKVFPSKFETAFKKAGRRLYRFRTADRLNK